MQLFGSSEQLWLTEKQYNNIYMVAGGFDYQEKTVGMNAYIMVSYRCW